MDRAEIKKVVQEFGNVMKVGYESITGGIVWIERGFFEQWSHSSNLELGGENTFRERQINQSSNDFRKN